MVVQDLDVIVRTHGIPSIRTLTQAMKNNQVLLQVNRYINKAMHDATSDDLQLSGNNMQKYIGGPTTLTKTLCMLQGELDRGFRTIYLESMEARVCFEKDITKQNGDTIAHYQYWYQFIIEDHHEDVTELVFL